jgi:anti-sigma regulatory factor (Ser/Thr protein kinase)/sulfur carrier protein ThiS
VTPDEVPVAEVLVLVHGSHARTAWLHEVLAQQPELRVVEEVTTISEALASVSQRQPQVVVADLGADIDADNGIVASLHELAPAAHIVLHAGVSDLGEGPGAHRWLSLVTAAVEDPARAAGLEARLTLSQQARSVPDGRSFVTNLLAGWGLDSYIEPVRLVTSELVANSVRHVRGSCAVELTCHEDVVRVAVADSDSALPTIQALSPASECGRGLHLVSAFSSAWGVESLNDGGKVVWAELESVPSALS